MYGKIEWQNGENVREECIAIDGVLFAVMRFSKTRGVSPRVVRRAAKKLYRMGVRQILLQPGMPADLWRKYRLTPISAAPLREKTAAEIVRAWLREQSINAAAAHLVLCGEYVTESVLQCAGQLCRTVRYFSLCFSYGAEGAAQWLCRSYGVAVRVLRRVDETATLCVYFAECAPDALSLALFSPDLEITYSDGREEAVLAALNQAGALALKPLRVKKIRRKGES